MGHLAGETFMQVRAGQIMLGGENNKKRLSFKAFRSPQIRGVLKLTFACVVELRVLPTMFTEDCTEV